MSTTLKMAGAVILTGCMVASSTFAAPKRTFPTHQPTDPGTPPLIAAGPEAEAQAQAALAKTPGAADAASNPSNGAPGANPPSDVDGNFVIGPDYVKAPELSTNTDVPHGTVKQFVMKSTSSRYYSGIARSAQPQLDPNNPKSLIVQIHPEPYERMITVYIPKRYAPGTAAPFLVKHDGPKKDEKLDQGLFHILDNLIAQHRIPAMVLVMIANGGGDAQGSERGLEYDTMSGKFAEFIQAEVLPAVESRCEVKLTSDPEGRATMGFSSGGAAALAMAWYHPEWYHRVITYSGTFVNQQWPYNPKTQDGAWDFHEKLIPNNPLKPIRIWMEVGDRDLLNPNAMRDNMHDWVGANNRMATVLRAKGYHYQYVYARNAGHVDGAVRSQTMPEALEWTWRGYPK